MTRWFLYLKLETKKGMKFIPFFLMSVILAAGAVVLAAVLFCAAMNRRQLFPKAEVAIVLNSDGSDDTVESEGFVDLKTGMMIGVVESMSSVKSVCDFTYMSPKAAADGLADGTVDAAVYLPRGVYDDINNGGNTPVLIRLSERNAALRSGVFRQLVADGVSLIRTVETAIYAVDRVSERAAAAGGEAAVGNKSAAAGSESVLEPVAGGTDGTSQDGEAAGQFQLVTTLAEAEDLLFNVYVKCALARDSIFSSASVSAFGGLTMFQFYAVTALLFILLLFGIGFSAFYSEGERNTVRTLRRMGLHPVAAGAAKVLAITAVLGVLLFIILFFYGMISWVVFKNGTAADASSAAQTAAASLSAIVRALPQALSAALRQLPRVAALAFSVAAAVHLVYSFAPTKGSELVYLLIIVALFTLAGGILPVSWMPRGLRAAAQHLPVQVWQGVIAEMLYGAQTGGATELSSVASGFASTASGLAAASGLGTLASGSAAASGLGTSASGFAAAFSKLAAAPGLAAAAFGLVLLVPSCIRGLFHD